MTVAAYSDIPRVRREGRAKAITLPSPQPFGAPVLIGDCVTPMGGETLLSLLFKRMMSEQEEDPHP